MSVTCPEHIRDVMLDCVADGVFTVDADRRITCFNRAAEKITGVPRAEAIGQHCFDILHGSRCEEDCALLQTIQNGRPVVCKGCHIVNAQGQCVPISISTSMRQQSTLPRRTTLTRETYRNIRHLKASRNPRLAKDNRPSHDAIDEAAGGELRERFISASI